MEEPVRFNTPETYSVTQPQAGLEYYCSVLGSLVSIPAPRFIPMFIPATVHIAFKTAGHDHDQQTGTMYRQGRFSICNSLKELLHDSHCNNFERNWMILFCSLKICPNLDLGSPLQVLPHNQHGGIVGRFHDIKRRVLS